jgi:uncharacterized protein YecE (DUF72 family)
VRPVRVGCSGWNYGHWRERVYPKGVPARRWLEYYATLLDTVEVNATFYRLPNRSAVAGWVEQTPSDFVFAVKASRYLTHLKRLTDLGSGVERFYERIEPLVEGGKLGPVLWQLPENFHRNDERLSEALEAVPPGRHAFEFRHPSWFDDGVYSLLGEHGVALVIGHERSRWVSTPLVRTTDWTYVRLHHGSRGRHGNYSDGEISTWARRLSQWRRDTEVYTYFNNDWQGFAIRNARLLKRKLGL